MVSTRSIDPSSKHGCVLVNKDNIIIGCGYNGPISQIDDSQVPLTRPEKYAFFAHAEENALLFCNGDTKGGTAYVNGIPCSRCIRMLCQKKFKRIVYGSLHAKCVDEQDYRVGRLMASLKGVVLEKLG